MNTIAKPFGAFEDVLRVEKIKGSALFITWRIWAHIKKIKELFFMPYFTRAGDSSVHTVPALPETPPRPLGADSLIPAAD